MAKINDKKKSEQLSLLKQQVSQLQAMSKDVAAETLKTIEDEVLAESISIVKDCLNFADLGFDQEDNPITPESWDALPFEEKERKLRLARATWMPAGDVPFGIKLAHASMMGIIKARATKESGTKTLNIEYASFPAPAPLAKKEYNDEDVIDVTDTYESKR